MISAEAGNVHRRSPEAAFADQLSLVDETSDLERSGTEFGSRSTQQPKELVFKYLGLGWACFPLPMDRNGNWLEILNNQLSGIICIL